MKRRIAIMLQVPLTVQINTEEITVESAESPVIALTRRETEVVVRLCQNKTNKEIAGELNLSLRTAKFHVSSILAKYKCTSRTELAVRLNALTGETITIQ